MDKELEVYKKMIAEKAAAKSTDVLPNAGKNHAGVVMAQMFHETNETVRMIVGSFDGNVSDQDDYIKNMTACIEKNVRIQVIFLDKPNELSKAYQLLKEKKNEHKDITLKQATTSVIDRFTKKGEQVHYSVFDKSMYRYEKNTKKYTAIVCFNDEKNAQILNRIFDESFIASELIA